MLNDHRIYESHNTDYPHKSFNHKRQDIAWENHPNTKDENPNHSLSMIDGFANNDLQHITRFPNKRYHLGSREERANTTLYSIVLNLPYAYHINKRPKQLACTKI